MIIGYLRRDPQENGYLTRNREILSNLGTVVALPTTKELLLNPFFYLIPRLDVAILNWSENILVSNREGKNKGKITWIRVACYAAFLLFMQMKAKRVLRVYHNRAPHATNESEVSKAEKIIRAFDALVTDVVSLSPTCLEGDAFYVPHPLYPESIVNEPKTRARSPYFFVFGRILRYKRIDELLNSIPKDVSILVAGRSPDADYIAELKSACVDSNIQIIDSFIDEGEAIDLARCSEGILICHRENATVSGAYMFGLSHGVPVYALSTPFFHWIQSLSGSTGLHLFEDLKSMADALKNVSPENSEKIKEFGNSYFGEEIVREAWKNVLGVPGVG